MIKQKNTIKKQKNSERKSPQKQKEEPKGYDTLEEYVEIQELYACPIPNSKKSKDNNYPKINKL